MVCGQNLPRYSPLTIYSLLFLFLVLFGEHFKKCLAACPKELLWNKKSNMGDEVGLQLQVCCNVTEVTIQKMDPEKEWTMANEGPIVKQLMNEEVDEIWSELQLSVCEEDQMATLGYVQSRPGNKCAHPQGQVISVSPDLFDMDHWFVICYRTVENCEYCHFEILCQNEFSIACSRVWMQSSASVIKNDSMTLWVQIGERLPFSTSSTIKVTVTDKRSNQVVAKYALMPQLNETMNINVENLESSNFYHVETCLDIVPPKHFKDRYHFAMEKPRLMCQQNVYRTFPNLNYKSHATAKNHLSPLFSLLFIRFVFTSLV